MRGEQIIRMPDEIDALEGGIRREGEPITLAGLSPGIHQTRLSEELHLSVVWLGIHVSQDQGERSLVPVLEQHGYLSQAYLGFGLLMMQMRGDDVQ